MSYNHLNVSLDELVRRADAAARTPRNAAPQGSPHFRPRGCLEIDGALSNPRVALNGYAPAVYRPSPQDEEAMRAEGFTAYTRSALIRACGEYIPQLFIHARADGALPHTVPARFEDEQASNVPVRVNLTHLICRFIQEYKNSEEVPPVFSRHGSFRTDTAYFRILDEDTDAELYGEDAQQELFDGVDEHFTAALHLVPYLDRCF
jgi:hypothetical protein